MQYQTVSIFVSDKQRLIVEKYAIKLLLFYSFCIYTSVYTMLHNQRDISSVINMTLVCKVQIHKQASH